jgi:hypothetical protein
MVLFAFPFSIVAHVSTCSTFRRHFPGRLRQANTIRRIRRTHLGHLFFLNRVRVVLVLHLFPASIDCSDGGSILGPTWQSKYNSAW